jgi:hypothetical protein
MPFMRSADLLGAFAFVVETAGWVTLFASPRGVGLAASLVLIALGLLLWGAIPAPNSPKWSGLAPWRPGDLLAWRFRDLRNKVQGWDERRTSARAP